MCGLSAAMRREEIRLTREYTLQQVREVKELRELMPQIDLDSITFDTGSAASAGLEELAEVGSTGTLQGSLTSGDNITIANGGPFFPGSSNTVTFNAHNRDSVMDRICLEFRCFILLAEL